MALANDSINLTPASRSNANTVVNEECQGQTLQRRTRAVLVTAGCRLVWWGRLPHYQPLAFEIKSVYLTVSPDGTELARLYGQLFWHCRGSVIIISLTTVHQRYITSESI